MAKKKRRGESVNVSPDDNKPGSIRNAKGLSPLLEEIARGIFAKVGHFAYPTFEQWELGFMRDLHPWQEILIWENIARTYDLYLAQHTEDVNSEQIVAAILAVSTGQMPENLTESEKELRKTYLEASKKQWIPLFGGPSEFSPDQALVLQYRNIIDEWDGGIFPNLRGKEDCRRILADADIILGMDSISEEMFCIYGSERLERGGVPEGLKTVVVRLDSENKKTHELEKMCFVVERIKGRHDCQ
jgi:hypothetical protein